MFKFMDDLPVLGEFYQAVHEDLATRFHPEMERLQEVLSVGSQDFRAALKSRIRQYSGGEVDATVIGLDASSRMADAGEVATIIACGVAVSNRSGIKPLHILRSAFGTASEELGRAKSAITVCAEIDAAIAAAEINDATILWDGGFSALNLEINKAVSALEDAAEYVKPDVDRLLTGKTPLAKTLFADNGNRLISVAKKGISKQYAKQIEKKLALPVELGLSDKAILGRVLEPGEYTVPVGYSAVFGSDKGFGIPRKDMNWLADFYSKIRVTYFKPHPWSSPMRVEFQESLGVQTVLGIVTAQTTTRAVMEPLQIYMADLLANQCSHAMKLYGDVNARRYPDLYKPTRTVSRK